LNAPAFFSCPLGRLEFPRTCILQRLLAMELTYAASLLALPAARRGLSSSLGTSSTPSCAQSRYALQRHCNMLDPFAPQGPEEIERECISPPLSRYCGKRARRSPGTRSGIFSAKAARNSRTRSSPFLPRFLTKLLCGTLKSVNRVKDLRIARGLTAAELAERSGVGYRTVRRLERNLVRPHTRTLRRLAEALGVEPSELARLMSEAPQDPNRRGSLLSDLRVASGMSRVQLARRAGISQSFLSGLERGKHEAGPRTVPKLAEALGVHPLELIRT
jgi:transcriptional regulator with XRE-family HTH domain